MKKQTTPKIDRFTRGARDTWNGIVDGFGLCNFSVIGTYGDKCDPRIVINRSVEPTNCHSLAIDWNTGKVLKAWGNGNSAVDHIE
jgi:hypothetical protein